ncbi:gamma-glutamyltransferase 2 [Actinocorallia herbida]|uniref:Gamma-glutamyltransferase 2 n=1 Tax=Actinocorallia herbida TaxID=58109 RepID=A0A3N1D142_9ACTN|nr:gamma-glutamyltransferase [Actinocorallia herbida]ROO87234.1 gamma-glutamyltransferase 2 [Actinocorallia herbida]
MTIAQGFEQPLTPAARGAGMGGGVVPGVFAGAESMRPTLLGERWAVVAGHPLVSQVAAEILGRGGNAVDAGVAAGLASNVVQADMANFGGIAPVLVRTAGSATAHSVAGVGRWGRAATLDAMLARHGGKLPLGGAPSIVPGAPSGWITTLREFGTLSFAEAAAPAIELAEEGFPLDVRTAHSLTVMGRGFSQWESSRAVYWPEGRAPRPGERLTQPELGALLRSLADAETAAIGAGAGRDGGLRAAHDAFYRGEPARRIAEFVTAAGGFLDVGDLASFTAEVGEAPAVRFGDRTVHVTPAWSQGLIVAQALGVLGGHDLAAAGHNSETYLHLVTEALKLAFAERERHYGDPAHTAADPADLLAPARLDALRARIGHRALPDLPAPDDGRPRIGSTTAIVVMDADGNAFASSPSDTADGAPLIPGLGILCSPRGVQSRLVAGHPNVIAPGKRPCVTPAAMITLTDRPGGGEPAVGALACPGGDVIVQAMLQAFLNDAVFGMTAQQAVEAPRVFGSSFPGGFHPHPSGGGLLLVEDRIPAAVRDALAARGHLVRPWPAYEFDAGSVQTVGDLVPPSLDGRRVLAAGADPRRSAYAAAR